MKAYSAYKDSGIEWVGEVPENWQSIKIKNLASEKGSFFNDGDWIESKSIEDKGIRYLTTGNVGPGYYKEQGQGYISEKSFEELNCTAVYEGDLIISRLNPPIGRCCFVPLLGEKVVVAVDIVILRPDKNFDKRFLRYSFTAPGYFESTSLLARGATMQRLSRGLLGNIKIPIPKSIEEQTAIANFLDHKTAEIDLSIEKRRELIELLKEQRSAIINEAVTKGINPDAPMKDSGVEWIGEIPEHWTTPKMKFTSEFILDGTHSSFSRVENGYRLLSVRNIINSKFVFREDDSKVSENDFLSISSKFLIQAGDIQLAIVGATLGKVAIVPKLDEEFVTQRSLATIRVTKNKCKDQFLFHSIQSKMFQEYLWKHTGYSAQPGIYLGTLQNINIALPPLDEQNMISQHIEIETTQIDKEVKSTQQEIDLLEEYRQSLIAEAVTGKIDVRDYPLN